MSIPLEDHAGDVCAKAMRGHRIAPLTAAARAGILNMDTDAVASGRASPETYRALAPVLGLDAASLERLARGGYAPATVAASGLHQINLPYEDMRVNVYVAEDPVTREAVLFDAAGDADAVERAVRAIGCRVCVILLTHEHEDHIDAAAELCRRFGVTAWIARDARDARFEPFDAGAVWRAGALRVRAVATPGHAAGGTTFVVEGPRWTAAVVGDAIFAGSAGGARGGFAEALRIVRDRILSLPPTTVIAPGHGPMTTVGEELAHNPFFAGAAAPPR